MPIFVRNRELKFTEVNENTRYRTQRELTGKDQMPGQGRA